MIHGQQRARKEPLQYIFNPAILIHWRSEGMGMIQRSFSCSGYYYHPLKIKLPCRVPSIPVKMLNDLIHKALSHRNTWMSCGNEIKVQSRRFWGSYRATTRFGLWRDNNWTFVTTKQDLFGCFTIHLIELRMNSKDNLRTNTYQNIRSLSYSLHIWTFILYTNLNSGSFSRSSSGEVDTEDIIIII